MRRSLAGFPEVEVHTTAIGDEDAVVTFHPHTYTLSSSALPMGDEARGRYRWAEERPPIEVPLRRLDSVLGDRRLGRPALLKLDVQGYELKVLAGAGAVLDQVDAIVLEQSFERFYEGQPLFTETNRFLESTGMAPGPSSRLASGGRPGGRGGLSIPPGGLRGSMVAARNDAARARMAATYSHR